MPLPAEPIPPAKRTPLADDDRPTIVNIHSLEKTYDIGTPLETKALRGVNLEISLAEIVIIFGPSGSGKSTLLNILAGLDEPTGGEAIIDNKNLRLMSAAQLAQYHQFKVGMVFQSYNLLGTLTVIQNITMPARLAGFKKKDYLARGDDLLKQFNLEKLRDKLPSQCSGGQQQRVGIMRAFMNRPALIIADEPTGNLDSGSSKQIMHLFKNLNTDTNTTMIIVTHDSTLFAIADRVVHVLDGKVVKQTILTPKAKVDPATAGVPIEYKYRTQDIDTYIDDLKDGTGEEQAEAAGPKRKLEQRTKLLAKREEKLRQFWQRIRSMEERIDKRSQELMEARAFIAKESDKLSRTRQHLIVEQITIRQDRDDLRERSATLRHAVKEELKQLEMTAATQQRELAAEKKQLQEKSAELLVKEQELQQIQAGLTLQQQRLLAETKSQQQQTENLKRSEQEKMAVIAQQQEKISDRKKLLETEQYQLELWRKQLDQWADDLEEAVAHKISQVRTALVKEQTRSRQLQQHMQRAQEKTFQEEQRLVVAKITLVHDREDIQNEWSRLREEQKNLQQRAERNNQEEQWAIEMRQALKARKSWLDAEEKRLQTQEQKLEAAEKSLAQKQSVQERLWQGKEDELRKRIQAARQLLELAEKQMLDARRTDSSKSAVSELEVRYKEKLVELEQERQALAEQRAALNQSLINQAVEDRLSTAANIIDHEKEQLETEHQEQIEAMQARHRLMEQKLAAARNIIAKETAVIEQEYKVLEEEKKLRQLEEQQLQKEKTRIEKEWERLQRYGGTKTEES